MWKTASHGLVFPKASLLRKAPALVLQFLGEQLEVGLGTGFKSLNCLEGKKKNLREGGRSKLFSFVLLTSICKALCAATGHRAVCCVLSGLHGRAKEICFINWAGRCSFILCCAVLFFPSYSVQSSKSLRDIQREGDSLRSWHMDGWKYPTERFLWLDAEFLLRPVCHYGWSKSQGAQFDVLKGSELNWSGLAYALFLCYVCYVSNQAEIPSCHRNVWGCPGGGRNLKPSSRSSLPAGRTKPIQVVEANFGYHCFVGVKCVGRWETLQESIFLSSFGLLHEDL